MDAGPLHAETAETAETLATLAIRPLDDVPDALIRTARHSLFDTLVVMRAGAHEPVAQIMRAEALNGGGRADASVCGSAIRVPARTAALTNGTIAHALDYDDTHFGHVGHVSVAVLPAALAVGEAANASARDVLVAFALGAEAACRAGRALGRSHYLKGFHQTGTSGAFGAAVAAARLYGLDGPAARHAISLVATLAAGLKCQFGTMGKPLNAGAAAANGVEAAGLASRGFKAADDGFAGPQGFIGTHDGEGASAGRALLFPANTYKFHACCHGTHAMIEALRSLIGKTAEVTHIIVRTNPRWLAVCDLKAPRTALEVKFSYAALAAMVLAGISTASDKAYTDALAHDPRIKRVLDRVTVIGDDGVADTAATVSVTFADGTERSKAHDLATPMDTDALGARLTDKARSVVGPTTADRLTRATASIDELSARDLGALIADA